MHDHAHHDHAHGAPLRALAVALAITGTVFVAEVAGGLLSGSMALLADAMHMLSDAAGLIISLIAIIVGQKAASATATYGYRRVEVLAALINAVAVLSISVWIVVEAVRRLRDPQPVETAPMMAVALIGLIANAASAWVLARHREGSINVQGAYLHVLVDMFGSIAVLAAGAVIALTGFTGADVVASLVIAALVLPRAWQLMVRSARVMLEHVPAGFDADEVERALQQVDGATDTHDLHLWSLDGVSVLATVHVVAGAGVDRDQLLDRVQDTLAQLGVEHATVQIEPPEHIGHENVC
ncbi:cation diffusion facilitator family transporter [uncultured Corynebacterium sp.]|uniref:cation diffusion facilitator family transporter n=1 Tax=uncultured Corynebacterium sp. TaxID=159447 RepID=UPI0025DC14B0|nr:cation diffusion facilitator family transporter [uncultured Corynebacterium sp.]